MRVHTRKDEPLKKKKKVEAKDCPRCGRRCLIDGVCRMNMPYYGCGWRMPTHVDNDSADDAGWGEDK